MTRQRQPGPVTRLSPSAMPADISDDGRSDGHLSAAGGIVGGGDVGGGGGERLWTAVVK